MSTRRWQVYQVVSTFQVRNELCGELHLRMEVFRYVQGLNGYAKNLAAGTKKGCVKRKYVFQESSHNG